jgi:hypothetical protein
MSWTNKRTLVPIVLFISTIYSCNSNNITEKQNTQTIDPNEIHLNTIQHDTLNADQIEKIKKIQSTFSEVNPSSLEQTITDFKRDRNPDNEIAIWLAMANAYEKFTTKKTLDLDKKKEAYKLILMRSMESEEDTKINSNLKLLTPKEISEILSYYDLEAKPITIEQK